MKNFLLLFILSIIGIAAKAQAPTIGDVFNYDIGDEFQSRYPLAPPNLTRFVVTGKYFSATSDTVFYVRQNDNYFANISGGMPPALVYNATSFADTIYYTHLTDPITSLMNYTINDSCDSYHDSVYASPDYCGAQIYENNTCLDCCFEGTMYNEAYGVGLGWLVHDYQYPAMNAHTRMVQFFYSKAASGETCGTADRTYYAGLNQVAAKKQSIFYPNPSSGALTVINVQSGTIIRVYNAAGALVLEHKLDTNGMLDVSSLNAGLYVLTLQAGDRLSSEKLVIDKNQ